MSYKLQSGPKQPSIINHNGKYRELPHTTPATSNTVVRDTVAKMEPSQGIAYALAAVADNLSALTDMVSLRGEEIRTELAQLSENTMNTNDTEGRD
ncbi:hypothetical protein [Bifidobacterium dentium]|uniref:hypothetical protein n=1 Tax=Bifidobacterium dentium TaxID=1689 RepID=UPI0018B0E16B|nr:hypothetical protein [Bifidobacterium dentium]MBF9693489.1 hypothetical protein [Bifidobacterium dentium]